VVVPVPAADVDVHMAAVVVPAVAVMPTSHGCEGNGGG